MVDETDSTKTLVALSELKALEGRWLRDLLRMAFNMSILGLNYIPIIKILMNLLLSLIGNMHIYHIFSTGSIPSKLKIL